MCEEYEGRITEVPKAVRHIKPDPPWPPPVPMPWPPWPNQPPDGGPPDPPPDGGPPNPPEEPPEDKRKKRPPFPPLPFPPLPPFPIQVPPDDGSPGGDGEKKPEVKPRYKQWVDMIGSCPVCAANASYGPVPWDFVYPDGSSEPPAHDHCRCDVQEVSLDDVPISQIQQDFPGWVDPANHPYK